VIGITDFDRYSVAGALVIGPVIGGVAGLLLARSVISFRRMLLKLEDGSEQFKKWYSNRWVRILDRLLVGKRTKEAKVLFTAKTKIIRMPGVVVAVLVLVVSISAAALLKNEATRDYVVSKMTQANGAEVNVDRLGISALTGAFSASGVEVTDPEDHRKNQVSVGNVAADISLYDLLLGKLVMEQVEVVDVDFGTDRAAPGKLVQEDAEDRPAVFDPCDFALGTGDTSKLETYLKDAKAAKKWLQKVSKWLPEAKDKESESDLKEIPQEYLGYLQARAATPASPRILAEKVLLDKVQIPSQLFGSSKISLENISDSVQAAGLPVKAAVKSYDTPVVLAITFDYAAENGPVVSGNFDGVDLGQMQSDISSNAGLAFTKGTASGQFDGLITRDAVDLTVDLTIRDMQATAQGDGILGLGSKNTAEALEALENLHTKIRIVGPVSEPRLVFDTKGLQEEFKNALIKAGKAKLAEEIDKQVEKQLGDKVPGEVGDVLKKPDGLIEGIGGLFRSEGEKQEKED
jgi:hypothetical protein